MIRVVEYAMNAPLRKGDARIRHRGPGSRRTNCELYGSSPTHSPYNRWLRDDWWFHIPSFPLIQFYTCITGNLPWPTAGNTETGGRQKRTTLCWGDYEVQVQRATTDLYKVRRDIWYRTRDWYANGLIITYQSLPESILGVLIQMCWSSLPTNISTTFVRKQQDRTAICCPFRQKRSNDLKVF